jgi:hypothetical protein
MTLAQWREQYPGWYVAQHASGGYWLKDNGESMTNERWELWHLDDYAVSSVTGGSIWLVQREVAPYWLQDTRGGAK